MISDHFRLALDKLQLTLKGWDKLQISLWGRIQTRKMVITPKLNYLLSMLPPGVPGTLDKMFRQCIWAWKRQRMKRTKLQAKTQYGGLRLPNMSLYQKEFIGAQIVYLLSQIHVGRFRGRNECPIQGNTWEYLASFT